MCVWDIKRGNVRKKRRKEMRRDEGMKTGEATKGRLNKKGKGETTRRIRITKKREKKEREIKLRKKR